MTRTSLVRCSKRRMLTSPVVMTCPPSTEVTRVIGTKTRRRPGTSTTRPMTRGRRREAPKVTTTSRTRPTWSPSGSKTLRLVRRPTKTRDGVLTPARLSGGARLVREASATPSSWPAAEVPGPPTGRRRLGRRHRCGAGGVGIVAGRLDRGAERRQGSDRALLPPPGDDVANGVEAAGLQCFGRGLPEVVARGDGAHAGAHRQQPAAGVLLRRMRTTSSGSQGRDCSPGPETTNTVSASHACQAGQARSPGTSIHSRPDFPAASANSAVMFTGVGAAASSCEGLTLGSVTP